MTWAEIDQLRRDGTPEETVQEVIRRQGLDLPHAPSLVRVGPNRWRTYCQGCTLAYGKQAEVCYQGRWNASTELIAAGPVVAVVQRAQAVLEGRP